MGEPLGVVQATLLAPLTPVQIKMIANWVVDTIVLTAGGKLGGTEIWQGLIFLGLLVGCLRLEQVLRWLSFLLLSRI